MPTNNIVPMPNNRSWKFHANRITAAWQKQIDSIIEVGKMLIEAKEELEHGSFEAMVNQKLPFGPLTAQRLMKIARHPILSNTSRAMLLPAAWTTLFELTKLDHDQLDAALDEGTINPKTERKDVARLRAGDAGEETDPPAPEILPPPPQPIDEAQLLAMIEDETICRILAKWAEGKTVSERATKAYHLIIPLVGPTSAGVTNVGYAQRREYTDDIVGEVSFNPTRGGRRGS